MDLVNSVIYGTLLGDASISKDKTTFVLTISHKVDQFPYLQWKASILGYKRKFKEYISGYGSRMKRISYYDLNRLAGIYQTCIIHRKKQVTENWVRHLNIVSLAVWYQDDGSWGKVGNKIGKDRRQRRVSFSACSFDRQSCDLLVNWLKTFGLKAKFVIRKNKYNMIELNHSSTVKFWQMVAPYIVLKTKLDLSKKSWSGYWVNHNAIGKKATGLARRIPPIRKKVFRYNLKSKALRRIKFNGQNYYLNQWAHKTGQHRETISRRLKRGWTVAEALGFKAHS
jgi:hypothetical protein